MKKKTKLKKAAPKKKKVTKELVAAINLVVRQITPKPMKVGNKHIVRLVTNCNPSLLTFNTTHELNLWLFDFDIENQGKDPQSTGTWIDHIILDVQGDIFDVDQLEERPE